MLIELLYLDGCPNWRATDERLQQALRLAGIDERIDHRVIETPDEAAAAGFAGSPTILLDGADPFAQDNSAVGLSCRVYPTPTGLAGAPTVEQLSAAITGNLAGRDAASAD